MNEIPTIQARRITRPDGVELFAFICPKCGQHITHGAAGGPGHRLAHCPCWPRGYFITEGGKQ